MAGYLAEELMQHYMIESWTRQGEAKRIRFSNGMSLNQMALEIGEICFTNGRKWFEPSSLSRVLSGDRLFTAHQLDAFCQVLRIYGEARWNLECAVVQDYIERLGFDFDLMDLAGFG